MRAIFVMKRLSWASFSSIDVFERPPVSRSTAGAVHVAWRWEAEDCQPNQHDGTNERHEMEGDIPTGSSKWNAFSPKSDGHFLDLRRNRLTQPRGSYFPTSIQVYWKGTQVHWNRREKLFMIQPNCFTYPKVCFATQNRLRNCGLSSITCTYKWIHINGYGPVEHFK